MLEMGLEDRGVRRAGCMQIQLLAPRLRDMTSTLERRRYPRCTAWLPLRLIAVGGEVEPDPATLRTQNFSKTGLCFPAPRHIEPGQSIEVEVILPAAGSDGHNIQVSGKGRIVRAESLEKPGWYKLAAVIDEPRSGDGPGWQKLAAAFDPQAPPINNP